MENKGMGQKQNIFVSRLHTKRRFWGTLLLNLYHSWTFITLPVPFITPQVVNLKGLLHQGRSIQDKLCTQVMFSRHNIVAISSIEAHNVTGKSLYVGAFGLLLCSIQKVTSNLRSLVWIISLKNQRNMRPKSTRRILIRRASVNASSLHLYSIFEKALEQD